jgi:hypothetical protein
MPRDASPSEVNIHRVFGRDLTSSIFPEDLAQCFCISEKFGVEPVLLIPNPFEDNQGRFENKRLTKTVVAL